MMTFYSKAGLETPFKEKYRVENSSSYDLLSRRLKTIYSPQNIQKCLYRPFDIRWVYYSLGLTSRPAWNVMQHMITGENTGLITTRQTQDNWDAFVATNLVGHKSVAAY
jgi:hypothetical protein